LETEVAGYISDRKAPHSMWGHVCYAKGVTSKYLHSTNHLGYDASLDPLQHQNDLSAC